MYLAAGTSVLIGCTGLPWLAATAMRTALRPSNLVTDEFSDNVQRRVDEPGGERRPRLSRPHDAGAVRRRGGRPLPVRQLRVDAATAVPDPVRTPHLSTVRRPAAGGCRCRRRRGPLSGRRRRLLQTHPTERESSSETATAAATTKGEGVKLGAYT